jgi:hypothetical protein
MIKSSSFPAWLDKGKPTEDLIAAILLIVSFCILVTVALISPGSEGIGGDNTMHYQISHFSWQHPELFLHHWGKPLYTLLSSPLAQFGYFGGRLFNILAGLATVWLAYLTLKRLGFRNAYLVIVFVVFAPIYFVTQIATLTEILFSLVLMSAIYLYFRNFILLSAIVLSFLPLARTEGIIILPIFALAYLFRKKWWAIPLLATGFLTYSLAGMHYYHDFLWLIHQNPYTTGTSIYGSGPLMHFAASTKNTTGLPIAGLAIIGSIVLFRKLLVTSGEERFKVLNILWMIFIPFAAFFIFHSLLWWKGLGGSLGLIRVIASVVPLCGIIAVIGFDAVFNRIKINRKLQIPFILIIGFIVVGNNFIINPVPVELDPANKIIVNVSDWIRKENKNNNKVYYYDPQICFNLDLDPWDNSTGRSIFQDGHLNTDSYPDGSFVVWDAHFGPNEGQVKLEEIMNIHNLQLVKVFRPEQPFKVLGGYNFEVYVFRKLSSTSPEVNNNALLQKLDQIDPVEYNSIPFVYTGFESIEDGKYSQKITSECAHTGKYSYKFAGTEEYGPGSSVLVSSVNGSATYPMIIQASVYVLLKEKPRTNQVSLVISIENKEKPYQYQVIDLGLNVEAGIWTKLSNSLTMAECQSPSDNIKVYLWRRGKDGVFLDDFSADIFIKKDK